MAVTLHYVEYIIFGVTLLVSLLIGIYFSKSGGKQATLEEYLVGNRKISFCPVAISLLVTFQSGISLLGLPVEIYHYGTQIYMGIIGLVIGYTVVAAFLVPVFHPLHLTSAYEYLEMRFRSRAVRTAASLLGILFTVTYMAVALYIPSLALETVTSLSARISIPLVALVTISYTMLGGMKAVVWTDVFQFLIMMTGVIVVLVKGVISLGGLEEVWQINADQSRIQFFNLDPDPRTRQTFWAVTLGTLTSWIGNGISQSGIQRMYSTSSIREARKAVLANIPASVILETLMALVGMVIFAFYYQSGCDPVRAGYISNSNQLVPFFVMEQMSFLPGFTGLFMACLFSATLSTLSSGLSAVAALIWEDIIDPNLSRNNKTRGTVVTKMTVVITGLITLGLSFLAMKFKGTITQITIGTLSATSGPLVGVFLLGMIVPWANAQGAIIGGFISFALCASMSIGSNFVHMPTQEMPTPEVPVFGCDVNTTLSNSSEIMHFSLVLNYTKITQPTTLNTSYVARSTQNSSGLWFFHISFLWYHLIGVLCTMVMGSVATLITGGFSDIPAEPRFVLPCIRNLKCFKKQYHSRSSMFIKNYHGLRVLRH